MWEVFYDKWEEQWLIAEFSRETSHKESASGWPLTFYFYEDAERSAQNRNNLLHRGEQGCRPTTRSAREAGEYDTYEAADIWPGGTVQYGESRG